jgi:hypothetical protein
LTGHRYKLKLRKGDEFPELEELAEKIANELRPIDEIHSLPILPAGHPTLEDESLKLADQK